jgi:hypothetical protein
MKSFLAEYTIVSRRLQKQEELYHRIMRLPALQGESVSRGL